MTGRSSKKPLWEPGLIPVPGGLLDWRDNQHFDRWQDRPCALCDKPTPMRSHYGEPVHKVCGFDHFLRQRLLTSSDVSVRPKASRIVTSFSGTC